MKKSDIRLKYLYKFHLIIDRESGPSGLFPRDVAEISQKLSCSFKGLWGKRGRRHAGRAIRRMNGAFVHATRKGRRPLFDGLKRATDRISPLRAQKFYLTLQHESCTKSHDRGLHLDRSGAA
jgi:hypothetical protein